jgi:TPR repeat protein
MTRGKLIGLGLVVAGMVAASGVRLRHRALPAGAGESRRLGARLSQLGDGDEARAAVAALDAAAARGEVAAELELGKLYLRGHATRPKDVVHARQWLSRAAAAGDAGAAYYLGVMAEEAADAQSAAKWLAAAASAGSPQAMFLLANAYRAGAGVPHDDHKALALYERAGELEYPAALQTLALAHRYGELGLDADEGESRRYALAAEHAIDHAPALP